MPWRRHNIRAIDIDNDIFSQENSEYIYVSAYMQNRGATTRSIFTTVKCTRRHVSIAIVTDAARGNRPSDRGVASRHRKWIMDYLSHLVY